MHDLKHPSLRRGWEVARGHAHPARLAGVERYEHGRAGRPPQRVRPRELATRVGTLELEIPKLRSGPSYLPSFLEARTRSEQAVLSVVMEVYVNT